MILAYLINQYPQPSQSFIRREIGALEAMGHVVHRFTVRRWPGQLVDAADQRELTKTEAILSAGPAALLWAVMWMKLTRPIRYVRALCTALSMGGTGERGRLYHLIYLAEACRLARRLAALKVEHLHAHFGTNSATVALLCGILGGPRWSFTVHGPEEFDKPAAIHLGAKIEQAAFVVAITDFCRSQAYRWCAHRHWKKIHIVHCGLDEVFLNQPTTTPVSEPRLVCIGRLSEQKGQQILIEAAAMLAARGVDFHLTLIGDGPMRGDIEKLIEHHQLAGKVELAGWMSGAQIRDSLVRSRALVLPSFAEGLPVVIMEALAMGRPIIGTQVAGIPELVAPAQTGWLIPPGNVYQLANAMAEALAASPDQLQRMGATGAAWVRQRHDVRTEAAKLALLFASAKS